MQADRFYIRWLEPTEKNSDAESLAVLIISAEAEELEFVLPNAASKAPSAMRPNEKLDLVAGSFSRAYPANELGGFEDLLIAIDRAQEAVTKPRG